jgi:dTDP-4-dehydrorhamnose reductase
MRVLVTGARGRLGCAVIAEFRRAGHAVTGLDRTSLDVTQPSAVRAAVSSHRPDVIVNCSAYNRVDDAETDRETAFAVNATGPAILAGVARHANAALVHYSSDFVFDGETTVPYSETDRTAPCNVYGASKLAGERHAVRAPLHWVLRLSSVFGGTDQDCRPTSIDWIADAICAGRSVPVFVDRVVSPSYAPDVAAATRRLVESRAPSGIYHCVNTGHGTWYDVAHYMTRELGVAASLQAASVLDRPQTARRPRFCALSTAKLTTQGIAMPHWQDAIRRHVSDRRPTAAASRRIVALAEAPAKSGSLSARSGTER